MWPLVLGPLLLAFGTAVLMPWLWRAWTRPQPEALPPAPQPQPRPLIARDVVLVSRARGLADRLRDQSRFAEAGYLEAHTAPDTYRQTDDLIALLREHGVSTSPGPASMTTPEIKLYHTPDVAACHASWGATCGPCSLAAALGRPVADVFDAVSDPPPADELPGLSPRKFRGYMGVLQMKAALERLRVRVRKAWSEPHEEAFRRALLEVAPWTDHAVLACLVWGGPWVGTRGEATMRHWVAFRHGYVGEAGPIWIYDWNASHRAAPEDCVETVGPRAGGWMRQPTWEARLLPSLLPDRSDGTWRIQWAGAVRP